MKCNTRIESDGTDAVQAVLKDKNRRIGLIFMDWEMRELDGVKAIKDIRMIEQQQGRTTPIKIVMTSG